MGAQRLQITLRHPCAISNAMTVLLHGKDTVLGLVTFTRLHFQFTNLLRRVFWKGILQVVESQDVYKYVE